MIREAQVAPGRGARKPVPRYVGQTSITSFYSTPPTKAPQVREDIIQLSAAGEDSSGRQQETPLRQQKGKKSSFPHDHPFLVELQHYLQSRHGRACSEREAKQICTEVSKYLYFANPHRLQKELLLIPQKWIGTCSA